MKILCSGDATSTPVLRRLFVAAAMLFIVWGCQTDLGIDDAEFQCQRENDCVGDASDIDAADAAGDARDANSDARADTTDATDADDSTNDATGDSGQDSTDADDADGTNSNHAFVTVWDTSLGGSMQRRVTLPLVDTGEYDFTVDWGDGETEEVMAFDDATAEHQYESPGTYTVRIEGTIKGWRFTNDTNASKLVEISNWGAFEFGAGESTFEGAVNLTITATDTPGLEDTTNLTHAFRNCSSLTDVPDMGGWDVSRVQSMQGMFTDATRFNADIAAWDVGRVSDMRFMFQGATAFNSDIGDWDVSGVGSMRGMFVDASSFNRDISGWDVSGVTDMQDMFWGAHNFNRDIGGCSANDTGWDVSGVSNMQSMFRDAESFNQDIGCWDVSSVTTMATMFADASFFDQDLSGWDISLVSDMAGMFSGIALSESHYNALLISFASQTVQSDVVFDAGTSRYSGSEATDARDELLDTHEWTISDGGLIQ